MAIFLVRPLAAFLIPEVRPADPMNFFVVAVVLLLFALLATCGAGRSGTARRPSGRAAA